MEVTLRAGAIRDSCAIWEQEAIRAVGIIGDERLAEWQVQVDGAGEGAGRAAG
jgi:hypothetical protein